MLQGSLTGRDSQLQTIPATLLQDLDDGFVVFFLINALLGWCCDPARHWADSPPSSRTCARGPGLPTTLVNRRL